MAQPHELRCYAYVNHPYAAVRDALRTDGRAIFARATKSAATRADALAATLRVELATVEVGTAIEITIVGAEETPAAGNHPATTRLQLRWKAARAAALFPAMEAELSVYPLSRGETQIDLRGSYRPPLGALGSAVDSLAGHRIAEASVHRFVDDVATLLRTEL